ncbi:hypothetical protein SOPP22_18250 [Shewanella sp. OPT22]|nr:hypothetical protein SOPP22_18250 [Shewanella sp. OPT22]
MTAPADVTSLHSSEKYYINFDPTILPSQIQPKEGQEFLLEVGKGDNCKVYKISLVEVRKDRSQQTSDPRVSVMGLKPRADELSGSTAQTYDAMTGSELRGQFFEVICTLKQGQKLSEAGQVVTCQVTNEALNHKFKVVKQEIDESERLKLREVFILDEKKIAFNHRTEDYFLEDAGKEKELKQFLDSIQPGFSGVMKVKLDRPPLKTDEKWRIETRYFTVTRINDPTKRQQFYITSVRTAKYDTETEKAITQMDDTNIRGKSHYAGVSKYLNDVYSGTVQAKVLGSRVQAPLDFTGLTFGKSLYDNFWFLKGANDKNIEKKQEELKLELKQLKGGLSVVIHTVLEQVNETVSYVTVARDLKTQQLRVTQISTEKDASELRKTIYLCEDELPKDLGFSKCLAKIEHSELAEKQKAAVMIGETTASDSVKLPQIEAQRSGGDEHQDAPNLSHSNTDPVQAKELKASFPKSPVETTHVVIANIQKTSDSATSSAPTRRRVSDTSGLTNARILVGNSSPDSSVVPITRPKSFVAPSHSDPQSNELEVHTESSSDLATNESTAVTKDLPVDQLEKVYKLEAAIAALESKGVTIDESTLIIIDGPDTLYRTRHRHSGPLKQTYSGLIGPNSTPKAILGLESKGASVLGIVPNALNYAYPVSQLASKNVRLKAVQGITTSKITSNDITRNLDANKVKTFKSLIVMSSSKDNSEKFVSVLNKEESLPALEKIYVVDVLEPNKDVRTGRVDTKPEFKQEFTRVSERRTFRRPKQRAEQSS